MEIYFKKLTQDLLEVCRMFDDKPEAKNKLSEITVDVSFLPDIGYAFGKGETEPPKEPGWYWMWCNNMRDGKPGFDMKEIMMLAGDLCVVACTEDGGDYTPVSDYVSDGLQYRWFGPIPKPKVPELKA
jgi:hypothetical protein